MRFWLLPLLMLAACASPLDQWVEPPEFTKADYEAVDHLAASRRSVELAGVEDPVAALNRAHPLHGFPRGRDVEAARRVVAAAHALRETEAKQDEERRQREVAEQAASRLRSYRSDFEMADTPERGDAFVKRYSDFDPDGLVQKVMQASYQRDMENQRRCISLSEKILSRQREVGAAVGIVDKNAIYWAGVNLTSCRSRLAYLQADCVRQRYCSDSPRK